MKSARFTIGLLLVASAALAQPQPTVSMADEPHHALLLSNDQVRVYAVSIPPHTSLPLIQHEHNFLVITLRECEIASWAEGNAGVITYRYERDDIRFFFGGPARALRNDTSAEYRNLTVEFLNPKVTTLGFQPESGHWEYGSSALSPPPDPQGKFTDVMKLGEAIVKDVQLLPDDEYPEPEKPLVELLIPLTDIDLKSTDQRIRKDAEELLWISPGRKSKWINNAGEPARLVVIEFQPSAEN